MMKRLLLVLAAVVIVALISCHLLLPERFAVNAPIAHMLFGRGGGAPDRESIEARLRVPSGFSLSIYAEGIPATARALQFTASGDLLVSTPRSASIQLLDRDADGDGRADGMHELLSGLNSPHGLALRDGWLYVGEADAIGRIRFDEQQGKTSGEYERVVTGLPGSGNHWKKTIHFGPDGWLYTNIGSTCNVCIEADERSASMMRFRADGTGGEIVSRGLRNSAGFDWQPGTGLLFATDNGRDLLGDDFPPCELNLIEQDRFYGWPIANGNRIPDPNFGDGQAERIAASTPPVHGFRAHNAPLGMTFIRGDRVPADYRGAALVALHGSWNRTDMDGYKVVSLHWEANGAIHEQDFLAGFELDGDVIGRPAYVAEGPDGAFYVSDDYAGVVWRVAYGEAQRAIAEPMRRKGPSDPPAGIGHTELTELSARGLALYREHRCATCHEPDAAPSGSAV